MKYYIIADTHFSHDRIINYCNRPFEDVQEMNRTLIKNWNEVVSNQDTVIHLGDLSLGNKEETRKIISQLNGKKILIKGNHDRWSDEAYRQMGFDYVSKFPIIFKGFFILSHAPMQLNETTPYFNYYGHVHNDNKYRDTETSRCVSVEKIGYKPVLMFDDEENKEV